MRRARARDGWIAEQYVGGKSSRSQKSQIGEILAGVCGKRNAIETVGDSEDGAGVGAEKGSGVFIADYDGVAAPGAGGGALRVALRGRIERGIGDKNRAAPAPQGYTQTTPPRSQQPTS